MRQTLFALIYIKTNSLCSFDRFGKVASQVVTCIVNNCVSATVRVPEPISPDLSPYLKTGQEVLFRIEKINLEKCIVHGTIDADCVDLMKKCIPLQETTGFGEDEGAPTNLDDF